MENTITQKPAGSVTTRWELITYNVWGNAKDGYEVNDLYRQGEITLRVPQTRYNVGTPAEFVSASPSDRQLREAFGLRRIQIDTDGDDLTIYVNARKDGYPIGELRCVSHASLSPVRKV